MYYFFKAFAGQIQQSVLGDSSLGQTPSWNSVKIRPQRQTLQHGRDDCKQLQTTACQLPWSKQSLGTFLAKVPVFGQSGMDTSFFPVKKPQSVDRS